MGLSLQSLSARNSKSLFPRAEEIFKAYDELFQSPKTRLKTRFFFLLSASFLFGFLAYGRSLETAKEQWLREHPPSLQTWVSFTKIQGFVEIQNSQWKEALTESAPMLKRDQNLLWIDSENRFLLLSRPEGLFFFQRATGTPRSPAQKTQWEALGRSWESIEALELRPFFDSESLGNKGAERNASTPTDPKRLNY